MIRRDDPHDARPAHWILITQPQHARLAGALAEHWGAGGVLPLAAHGAVLWAALHHDDGWQHWETCPDVNSVGQPRSFTEMEPTDSLAIWSRSIEIARVAGSLECCIVAGHFCALARRATLFLKQPDQLREVQRFIVAFETLMADQMAAWQLLDPVQNTADRAELALKQLQLFDALSLWFCGTPTGESETVETPGSVELTLTPHGETAVTVSPWPFREPGLNLEVQGRRVLAQAYGDAQELAAAAAQPVLLRWRLQSGLAAS